MYKPSFFLFTVGAVLLFSFKSTAATVRSGTGGIGLFASVNAGASSGSLKGSGMESRNFMVYGVSADLGLDWSSLLIGASVDYNLWRQMKDPAELNNSNAQGKETSIAATLGYDFKRFALVAKYYLSSKYTLDKANASGGQVAFTSPTSAFAVEARIPFGSGKPYVGLNYKVLKYKSIEEAGVESTLASDQQVEASAFGLSLGYSF